MIFFSPLSRLRLQYLLHEALSAHSPEQGQLQSGEQSSVNACTDSPLALRSDWPRRKQNALFRRTTALYVGAGKLGIPVSEIPEYVGIPSFQMHVRI